MVSPGKQYPAQATSKVASPLESVTCGLVNIAGAVKLGVETSETESPETGVAGPLSTVTVTVKSTEPPELETKAGLGLIESVE